MVNKSRYTDHIDSWVHGIGFGERCIVCGSRTEREHPYKPEDARCPLEFLTALSVETMLQHPRRGFIKLEDTVEVT